MTDIAQVTSVHQPFDTRIAEKITTSLSENGNSVVLVVAWNQSVGQTPYPVINVRRFQNRFLRATLGAALVVRAALRTGAQVLHLHDPELMLWIPIIRLFGRTVVFDMHENTPANILAKSWIPSFLRRPLGKLWRTLEWLLIRNTNVVFAEASYVEDYPWVRRYVVLQNYPRISVITPALRSNNTRLTLVYIGGVAQIRGSIVMLKVLNFLQSQDIEIGLRCIGPITDEHQLELRALSADLGVKDVEFLGYRPPRDAWELAAGCDIGLAILQPHPNYYGSYPTKMFEYMSLGLPVVVSDFPLYRNVVDETGCGIAVPPSSVDAIASAMQPILTSSELRAEMGRNGRSAVESTYSWEAERVGLFRFYDELLSTGRS